ncbi:peptidoglycan DD-metalloendopeptidase family protein [Geopseudomonas aromaticivorans]|nr:peptidoglycan DD-metalloendopeptidase family protein [Pseudomonas aromaticivorans]
MSNWMPRLLGGLCLSLSLGLLGGCASSSGTSESIGSQPGVGSSRQPVTHGQYRVRRGDTLYSIAFRYGWDWKALATRNHISAPYTIRVGQVIRFGGSGPVLPMAATTRAPAAVPAAGGNPVATQPQTVAPVSAASAGNVGEAQAARSSAGWIWPANGQLISLFSSNSSLNKGVDIDGELGQPVLAASGGSVVYAGSGLRGYGELVIIKHNDTYVSAYGHNRKLLVREGQQVKAGDRIAEMGATGTDRVKLHFEIRRQGKPVDPLQYLPSR